MAGLNNDYDIVIIQYVQRNNWRHMVEELVGKRGDEGSRGGRGGRGGRGRGRGRGNLKK